MSRFSIQTTSVSAISLIALLVLPCLITQPAQAAKRAKMRPRPAAIANVVADKPLCYAEMTGKGMVNLEKLCGVGLKKSVVDLSVDADGDGVPDQLLAVMKTFNQAMSSAKTPQEYEVALQRLENQLPYSDNVKRLQAQQRELQKQLGTGGNDAQNQALYKRLDNVQQQIFQDPSYTKVQEAMSKVYSKLN
jgi:hypothetical protein